MACPYFDPVRPRAMGNTPQSAMLPLGDDWTGVCRAVPGQSPEPEEAALRPLCNMGYVRGTCRRFPDGSHPDAVRFTIVRDDGASLSVYYVIERDHHPFAHGPLEYSLAGATFTTAPGSETLSHQAQAYVHSYLRRKAEALPR